MRGLSLVAASGGHSSSPCAGLSLSRPLLLRSTGSRCAGSVVVAHGPCCSVACGIFPDQGSNPCPLHWQADSQPLRHQGSPGFFIFSHLGASWWPCKFFETGLWVCMLWLPLLPFHMKNKQDEEKILGSYFLSFWIVQTLLHCLLASNATVKV